MNYNNFYEKVKAGITCFIISTASSYPRFFDDVISRLGRHVEYSIGTKTLDVIDLIKIITKYKVRSVCLCLILESQTQLFGYYLQIIISSSHRILKQQVTPSTIVTICFISVRGYYGAQWNARINVGTIFSLYPSYSDEGQESSQENELALLKYYLCRPCPVNQSMSVKKHGSNNPTTSTCLSNLMPPGVVCLKKR